MKKILVVGAGIAGLVAAYRLKNAGMDVTILEASSQAGGRMATSSEQGHIIDIGAQFLSSSYNTMLPLIEELDLTSELIPTKPFSAIVRNGKVQRLRHERFSSRLGYMLKSAGGGMRGASRAMFNGASLMRVSKTRKDDYTLWEQFDNEDAAEWFARKFGSDALEYVLEPMLEGFFFHAPENCSKAMAMNLMSFNMVKGNILTMKRGVGSVTQALAEKLNIHFETRVDKVVRTEAFSAMVQTDDREYEADYVVLAVPAPIAQDIYDAPSITERALLDTRYASTVLISLATSTNWSRKDKNLNDVYGFLIPRKERDLVGAIGIETNKCSKHTDAGELINVMTEGSKSPDMLQLSDEELVARVLPELERFFSGISKSVTYQKVTRWKHAQTLSPVGRATNIRAYRQNVRASLPILLAGDYMGIGSTDSAAHTGEWASDAILKATKQGRKRSA